MRWRWRRPDAGPQTAAPVEPAGADGGAEAPDPAPANGAGPIFVGRREQQERFVDLMIAAAPGPGGDRAVLLQVVGPGGTGKRALLDRLAAICDERDWRHGPVLDVAEVVESTRDEMLERIAHTLEPAPQHFDKFHGRVRGLRARQSGQPSTAARALAGTRAATSGAREVAPGLVTGVANVVAQNPLADIAVDRSEARRTLEEVQKVFMEGLAELAREHPERVALLFADLHLRPDEPNVRWLRRWLFPKLARMRVLLVLSAETEHKLGDVAAMFGDRHVVRLDRLSEDEATEFVVLAVGLREDAPLARALVRDSDRFPERLARFSDWFRDHPDALGAEEVPPDAKVWAVGGSAGELLGRVDSPYLRDLVLCASPLRWFNAELLTRIAVVCELTPDDPTERAASLVEHERRPSWVTPVEGGWAVSDGSDLDALRREFRRRTPGRAAAVHREAAEYHAEWMRAWERRQDDAAAGAADPGGGDAFEYRPILLSERRFADEDYEAALMEWSYHLVALAPERGFDILLDHVAEAMVEDEPRRALRLLDAVSGLRLPKTQALYRQRIGDIARALEGARHAEAIDLLGELTRAGAPTRRMAAGAEFLLGQRGIQIGQAAVTALPHFERAELILASLGDDDPHGRLLRFWNLTWLGWIGALSGRPREMVIPQLEAAAAIAEGRGAPELQAEAARAQALAMNQLGDRAAALRLIDEALAIARGARSPDTTARILCDRADLRRQAAVASGLGEPARSLDEAAADLRRARSIYAQLEDRGAEANVLVSLVAIALAQGDQEAARGLRDEAVGLRPADPFICNQIGMAYQEAGIAAGAEDAREALLDDAERHYAEAFTLSEEAVFLLNRAYVRGHRGDETGRRADLEEAARRDPGNLDVVIGLAQARHDQDDVALAQEAARAAAELILVVAPEARDEPDGDDDADAGDGPAADENPLRANLMTVLPLLAPADAAEVLSRWTEAAPDDAEGHLLLGLARRASPPAWPFAQDLGAAEHATARAASLAEARGDTALRARCLTELADLYARLGRPEEAERAARTATELAPNSAAADEIVSRLERMRGQSDAMIEPEDDERFVPPIAIEISDDLGRWIHPDQSPEGQEFFASMIDDVREALREAWGVPMSGLRFRFASDAGRRSVRILLFETLCRRLELTSEFMAGASPADCRAAVGVDGLAAARPLDGGPGTWVGEADVAPLLAAGVPVWDPRGIILAALVPSIGERGPFVGLDELAAIVSSGCDVPRDEALWLAGALRGLLAEGISLARLPDVVAVVRDDPDLPPGELAARVRAALGPDAGPAPIPVERIPLAPAAGAVERHGPALGVALSPQDAHLAAGLAGSEVAAETWAALGVTAPAVTAAIDDSLAGGELVVSVAGVPRVVASPTTAADWARRHPLSGPRGRAGALAPLPSGDEPVPTADLAARLLEEVVADDPGLAVGEASVAVAIRDAVRGLEGDDARWLEVLRELAARRVPLGSEERVVDGLEAADALHRGALAGAPAPAGGPVVLAESAPHRPIPDATAIGVVDTIAVTAEGDVATIRVAAEIAHTAPGELGARLTGPSGVCVDLVGGGADLRALRRGLDPETCPALQACVGRPAGGTWTLHVRDELAADTGTLFRWSMEITTTAPAPSATRDGAPPRETPRRPARVRVARRHASQVEHLAQRLQPGPSIVLALGDGLWDEMVDETDGPRPRCGALVMAAEAFFEARAVLLAGAMGPERRAALASRGYAIEINGVPRGAGEVPEGERFVLGSGGDGEDGPMPTLDGGRVAAAPGRWIAAEPGDPFAPEGLEPATWIASHVVACLAEATRELADLDWCRRFLDRLAVTSPLTVAAIRETLGDEVVAGALARLAADGVRLRDLRLLEYMLELGAAPDGEPALDAARPPEAEDGAPITPAALACFLRLRVGAAGDETAVEAVQVSPALEAWLRARLRESERWRPAYDLPAAEALLRAFGDAFRDRDDEWIVLVTSCDLRRHVRRLLAVQLPRVRVLAREELEHAAVTTVATVDPPDGLPGA